MTGQAIFQGYVYHPDIQRNFLKIKTQPQLRPVRHSLTWLQVLMSTPFFRKSRTLSMFPALAARRKLVLLSDCRDGAERSKEHLILETAIQVHF